MAINVLNDHIAHSPTISCSCKTTSVAVSSIGFTWSELIVLNRTRSPGELGSLSTNHCNDSIKESCKLSGVMQILTIHEMGGYYTAIIIGIHLYPDWGKKLVKIPLCSDSLLDPTVGKCIVFMISCQPKSSVAESYLERCLSSLPDKAVLVLFPKETKLFLIIYSICEVCCSYPKLALSCNTQSKSVSGL